MGFGWIFGGEGDKGWIFWGLGEGGMRCEGWVMMG